MTTCEIHVTIDDNDDGGPYDFTPCDKQPTRMILWPDNDGTPHALRVCSFHATGEI